MHIHKNQRTHNTKETDQVKVELWQKISDIWTSCKFARNSSCEYTVPSQSEEDGDGGKKPKDPL